MRYGMPFATDQRLLLGSAVAILAAIGSAAGHAQSLTTLQSFNSANGEYPYAGLVADAAGNLFGTTTNGGSTDYGTVYEIVKSGTTYASPMTLLLFQGLNGAYPYGTLAIDGAGNLLGATGNGGTPGWGTAFEIVKSGSTDNSTTTLGNFTGDDGANSYGTLTADAAGHLFGTSTHGGSGNGVVFEIAKTGSTYAAPVAIDAFDGTGGKWPVAGVTLDAAGDIFGTTQVGGASNSGTVFEIARTGSTYGAPITLVSLGGSNGAGPEAGVIIDTAGNLFGTTDYGGASGLGIVYEIPNIGSAYGAPIVLANLTSATGGIPMGGLTQDAAGDLFGTTDAGGASNKGTVFEIAKTGSTYGSLAVLATFDGTNGARPGYVTLIADMMGNLFGTTEVGGANNDGTVFEVTGSGFVPFAAPTSVPKPASLALLGGATLGLAGMRGLRRPEPTPWPTRPVPAEPAPCSAG